MSEKLPSAAGMGEAGGTPAVPLAGRAWQAWGRFLVPVVLGLWADLWVKGASFPDGVHRFSNPVLFRTQGRNPMDIEALIPHVLGFQTTVNAGAVFGIGQGMVPLFVLFSIVAIGTIGYVFARSMRKQMVLHLALGLILAGALGNLYDRVKFHGVRDMFIFTAQWRNGKLVYPFIFNVADVLLCVGVPLLMLCWILGGDGGSKMPAAAVPANGDVGAG